MAEKTRKVQCRMCWIKFNTSEDYQKEHCINCSHLAPGGRPTSVDLNYMDHFNRTRVEGSFKRED